METLAAWKLFNNTHKKNKSTTKEDK